MTLNSTFPESTFSQELRFWYGKQLSYPLKTETRTGAKTSCRRCIEFQPRKKEMAQFAVQVMTQVPSRTAAGTVRWSCCSYWTLWSACFIYESDLILQINYIHPSSGQILAATSCYWWYFCLRQLETRSCRWGIGRYEAKPQDGLVANAWTGYMDQQTQFSELQ